MSTNREFQDMLNEYLPLSLLEEEMLRRDWMLANVEKDDSWKGGPLKVPFEGNRATSLRFGSLTASNNVAKYNYVRGSVDDYVELWATLDFEHRDLLDHSGRVKEDSFLRMLPDQVERFMQYTQEMASIQMLNGAAFASAITDAAPSVPATGVMNVANIDRFTIDQEVQAADDDTNEVTLYVTAVNLNEDTVTFSATRGGAGFDFTAGGLTAAANLKFYHPGVLDTGVVTNSFTSLRESLLSLANGGSAQLYGQTKLLYPYLQAINIDGSGITATNLLENIFDGYTEIRTKARGNANTVLMSYKNLGSVMKQIETQKGAFKTSAETTKASLYGWTEIMVTTVRGDLKLVGIQEIDDDVIMYLDMSAMKWHSNGMFRRRTAPDGKQYFEERAQTGYKYILDTSLFGDLVVHAPTRCGIIYGISY